MRLSATTGLGLEAAGDFVDAIDVVDEAGCICGNAGNDCGAAKFGFDAAF